MVHEGSRFSTSLNVFRPSGNQNEWSSATPRSKSGCTAASHDVGKCTVPSFSGGRPAVLAPSSCAVATTGGNASSAVSIAARSIIVLLLLGSSAYLKARLDLAREELERSHHVLGREVAEGEDAEQIV